MSQIDENSGTAADNVTPIAAAPSPLSLKLGDALFSVLSVSVDWSGDYRAQFELYGLNVKAINSAVGTAVWHAGKGRFLSVLNGSLTEFDKGDGMKLLEDSCGKFWHRTDAFIARLTDLKIKTDDKVTKACIDMARAVRQAVAEFIMLRRQVAVVRLDVDMFATDPRVELVGETVTFVRPHAPYPVANADSDVVADWLVHFPQCHEFLDALVAARFASSRKNAYLFFRAQSDWGKGLLFGAGGVLSRLGATVELSEGELLNILSGANSGVTASHFMGALALIVNECTRVTKKHFRLEESLALTPKYLTTQCVNLYMKIFTSADPIPGLSDSDGIDPQVANRFSMLDLQGDIKTRPLFLSDKGRYVDSLTSFFAAELNARVASYQAKGFETARRDADHVLAAFTTAHGLANAAGLITDAYDEIRAEWVAFVHGRVADGHPDFLTFESKAGLVLRSPVGCWGKFLDWYVDKSEPLRRARLMHDRDLIIGCAKKYRDVGGAAEGKGVLIPFVSGSMPDNVHRFRYKN
ncbi:hypothetical protein KHA82_004341 [Salmonella enterica subsp. enterica serovar Infantis]|nr:hypothetical protein [Salmonella enterica subsp. enterica serovar Infantis]